MLVLPQEHRELLKKPFGTLFPEFSDVVPELSGKFVCTVGDVVTHSALASGILPDIGVIDGFTMRSPYPVMPGISGHILHVKNPAGTITCDLVRVLSEALSHTPCIVMVEGEEDLAVLPLAELLPDGAVILYGQPEEGVVLCEVSGRMRAAAKDLLSCFVEQ
jgi:uncharacterized protein (UPF0218 family)